MKFQRVSALAKKELKKTFREPAVLFMIFLFPIVFVLAFGASFGGLGSGQPTYAIGVVNLDQTNTANHTQSFINALLNMEIFSIRVYADNKTAQIDLSQGKTQAVIVIPGTFSQSLASYQAAPENPSLWVNSTVLIYVDKGSITATQAVPPIIQQVLNALADQTAQQDLTPISMQIASLVETKPLSTFEFMAPGMFTFASIFIIMMVAQAFTQDHENGMMKRIRTTTITPAEFMTSQILSYMLIPLIQAVIVFAATYVMGFRPNVDFAAYALAFTLVLIFSLSNVGFGLITATIAKTSSAATGLSFLFVLPQLFLGTFVGASLSSTAQIAGKFVPSYYVTDALTSLFLREAPVTSSNIIVDAVVISISCIAILLIGIILYAKYYKI
ncbi:MAG: ABC transporter permease [Nitrososphaerota archaeon]|nr:ABC transporter permease [Candidatus Bathyarchaeota archaeon]MDW8194384.1 ABC transporter permease [Nitrososphaerota archaeon]